LLDRAKKNKNKDNKQEHQRKRSATRTLVGDAGGVHGHLIKDKKNKTPGWPLLPCTPIVCNCVVHTAGVTHGYWTHRVKIRAGNEFYHPSGMNHIHQCAQGKSKKKYTHIQKQKIIIKKKK
jgi:hypothetical protein